MPICFIDLYFLISIHASIHAYKPARTLGFLFWILLASLPSGCMGRHDAYKQLCPDVKHQVSFPKTQQRIASSRIEPRESSFTMTISTLYHWSITAAWYWYAVMNAFYFRTQLSQYCTSLLISACFVMHLLKLTLLLLKWSTPTL